MERDGEGWRGMEGDGGGRRGTGERGGVTPKKFILIFQVRPIPKTLSGTPDEPRKVPPPILDHPRQPCRNKVRRKLAHRRTTKNPGYKIVV
jgi:hypothetical protein